MDEGNNQKAAAATAATGNHAIQLLNMLILRIRG
jgi:hypothetical protein